MGSALTFRHVNFRYREAPILVDATLHVAEGECVGMIGPNGGGKSTLLKLAMGLLKPESGDIQVFAHKPHTGCRYIGYVPQHLHFDPKFPITCLEVVLMGRIDRLPWWGRYSPSDRAAAHDGLRRVGLDGMEERPFASLSGGQKQRVLIARALFTNPQLLLLDEPTANVDLTVEARFVELLEELRERVTIILVTHDLGLVERLAREVICVNRRVHRHRVADLNGEILRQIYSGELREQHFGACPTACEPTATPRPEEA